MEHWRTVTEARDSRSPWWLWGTAIGVAAFWIIDIGVLRTGVPALLDDVWEYAVVASHLVVGDGFVTTVIHPPLWTLRDEYMRVPVLIHGPLMPIAMIPLLGLFGTNAVLHVAWLSAAFATGTALIVFRIAKRHFGPQVAVGSAALYTLAPITINAVHHDIAITVGGLFLMLTIDRVARHRPQAGLAGIALGFGYLVRPEFLLVAPIVAATTGGRAQPFYGGFIAVALPWWWHNTAAVMSPLFNLSSYLLIGYWRSYPDLTVLRDFDLPPSAWLATLWSMGTTLPEKWLDFFPHAAKRMFFAPSIGTSALAFLGLLGAVRYLPSRPLGVLGITLAAVPLAVMTLTVYDARYIGPFLPLWAIGGAFGAFLLSRALPQRLHDARIWLAFLGLLILPSTVGTITKEAQRTQALRHELVTERAALVELSERHDNPIDPIFSDTPDFAAWITGRPIVWLTRDEYSRLPVCPDHGAGRDASRPCRRAQVGERPGSTVWFHP